MSCVLVLILIVAGVGSNPARGGSNDNNVQWIELYHHAPGYSPTGEFVPGEAFTFRDVHANGQVYDDTNVGITILVDQDDLTSANVRYWVGSEGWAAMNWQKNWTGIFHGQASNAYGVWRASMPSFNTGTTVYYRIQLNDGSDTDWLFASGNDSQNPLGQWVADNATGGDWSYTILDDDTTGPAFSDAEWNVTQANRACVRIFDDQTASSDNDSGVYDDATGSGGQGVYLRWDTTRATVDGGGGSEVQLSLNSGERYCTDSDINPGSTFYFRIYAYNNDADNGQSSDRSQGVSATFASAPTSGASPDGNVWWNEAYHNTRASYYRTPFGAVPTGAAIDIRLRAAVNDLSNATLVVYNAEGGTIWNVQNTPASTDSNYAYYRFTIPAQATTRMLYYKFRLQDGSDCDWYVDDYAHNSYDHEDRYENGTGMMVPGLAGNPCSDTAAGYGDNSFNIMVYDASAYTNHLDAWAQNAIIYQIMPDRFRSGDAANHDDWPYDVYGVANIYHNQWNEPVCDPRSTDGGDGAAECQQNAWSADFFGGDLQGVMDQLDYLQSIGITALYLNPIFAAPSNHGYDTSDYLHINPRYGNNALFATLNTQAEARGIKIILDGVFNHTGSDSVYFDRYNHWNASGAAASGNDGSGGCENQASPYNGLYTFNAGSGPCTGRTDGNQQYNSWWGYDTLPLLNENAAVQNLVFDWGNDNIPANHVIQYWNSQGADGWRFDVADEVSHTFWQNFRTRVKNDDNLNGPLYSEVWYEASPWLYGDQLDATMNYRFRKTVLGFLIDSTWTDNDSNGDQTMVALSASEFDYALNSIREDYPTPAWYAMMNLVDSHDTNRALFVLRERSADLTASLAKMKLLAALQFTLPGAPTIYYGDEVGLGARDYAGYGTWGAGLDVSGTIQDDPYNRASYPWNEEAGVITGTLPVGLPNAALRDAYRTLGLARNNYDVLRTGDLVTLHIHDANRTYAYARTDANGAPDCAITLINRNTSQQVITLANVLPAACQDDTYYDVLHGGTAYIASGDDLATVTLAALDAALLVPQFGTPATLPPVDVTVTTSAVRIPAGGQVVVSATVRTLGGQTAPAGLAVNFVALSGSGRVITATATTNAQGIATSIYTTTRGIYDASVLQASLTSSDGKVRKGQAAVYSGYRQIVSSNLVVATGIGPQRVDLAPVYLLKRGLGEPVVALAVFAGNPVSNNPSSDIRSNFVDIHLSSATDVDALHIAIDCSSDCATGASLWWWDDSTTVWRAISGATFSASQASFVVTSASTPNLSQLNGTPFVVAGQQPTALGVQRLDGRSSPANGLALLLASLLLAAGGAGLLWWRQRRA
jgi:glycosidase